MLYTQQLVMWMQHLHCSVKHMELGISHYTRCLKQLLLFLIFNNFLLYIPSASRKKVLILGRLRPFQFPQKGHLNWNDNNSKNNGIFLAIFILHS